MFNNTHGRFCIALVTGTPGSGKSFCCARDIYNVMCSSDRAIVTNVPIVVDVMVQWVAKARSDLTEDQIRERIYILSPERLQRWQAQESGPWELAGEGLGKGVLIGEGDKERWSGADLLIDECHLFCPSTGDGTGENVREERKRWKDWLGEIRKESWRRVVFISQDDTKIGKPIQQHAELGYELTNGATDRDPWFKIPYGDWYSLFASFTGVYTPCVIVAEYRRENRRSVCTYKERVRLSPVYFQLYESFALPGGGAVDGVAERPKLEHEVRPTFWWGLVDGIRKAPVWAWFANKYRGRLAICLSIVMFGFWLCFLGGGKMIMGKAMASITSIASKMSVTGGDAKPKIESPPGPRSPAPAGEPNSQNSTVENANESEASGIDAKPKIDDPQFPAELASTMASLSFEQRKVMERAFRESTAKIRATTTELANLKAKTADLEAAALEPANIADLPKVTGFVGTNKAFIDGQIRKVGDYLLFNQGKNRVRIRKIDADERVVYLEDARVIRFAVRDADLRVPELAPPPVPTPPADAQRYIPPALQPVGGEATGTIKPAIPRNEKSILVPRSDGDGGILSPG